MDRFIETLSIKLVVDFNYLKSNMDRFIAKNLFYLTKFFKDLKSNMDRFIVLLYSWGVWVTSI